MSSIVSAHKWKRCGHQMNFKKIKIHLSNIESSIVSLPTNGKRGKYRPCKKKSKRVPEPSSPPA
jgi:hypothetical protein